MDQNKTNLPSLVRVPKSCQNLWTLRTHLTGVLVHGTGSFCFFDFLQWAHDCNLTLTCLLNTLREVSKCRPLPSKLLLQMDNCVRENKNKYVLAWLVEKKIFAEVSIIISYMYCFILTHDSYNQQTYQLSYNIEVSADRIRIPNGWTYPRGH